MTDITTATRNGESAEEAMESPAQESMESEAVEVQSPLEGIDISMTDVPADMEASEAQHQVDASVGATEPEVAPEGYKENPVQPDMITINEEKEKSFWGGFFGRP